MRAGASHPAAVGMRKEGPAGCRSSAWRAAGPGGHPQGASRKAITAAEERMKSVGGREGGSGRERGREATHERAWLSRVVGTRRRKPRCHEAPAGTGSKCRTLAPPQTLLPFRPRPWDTPPLAPPPRLPPPPLPPVPPAPRLPPLSLWWQPSAPQQLPPPPPAPQPAAAEAAPPPPPPLARALPLLLPAPAAWARAPLQPLRPLPPRRWRAPPPRPGPAWCQTCPAQKNFSGGGMHGAQLLARSLGLRVQTLSAFWQAPDTCCVLR